MSDRKYRQRGYQDRSDETARQKPAEKPARKDDTFGPRDRKSTRLNSSHLVISYAVFCLKKKKDKCDSHHTDVQFTQAKDSRLDSLGTTCREPNTRTSPQTSFKT